mgnify:CR=1 FL=1
MTMTLNQLFSILLLAIAAVMIYLGVKGNMLPPALTGAGFILIVIMFNQRQRRS